MSLLSKIFKRKPGGTFVGNLLRGGANKLTGGLLGNGLMKISQEEFDAKNNGTLQTNDVPILKQLAGKTSVINQIQNEVVDDVVPTVSNALKSKHNIDIHYDDNPTPLASNNMIMYIVGGILVLFLFIKKK